MYSGAECMHGLYAIFNMACVWHILFSIGHPFSMGLLAVLLICAGLFYDNAILAMGHSLDLKVLRDLSKPRFWLHSFVPVLAISLGEFIDRTLSGTGTVMANKGVWFFAFITPLQLYSMIRGKGLELEVKKGHGLIHYCRAGFHVLDIIPAVIITLYAMGTGLCLELYWLALGSIIMFGVSAAFPPTKHPLGGVYSNFGECCLMAGFISAESQLRQMAL